MFELPAFSIYPTLDTIVTMVNNCAACGRFMNKTELVTCTKCPLAFHSACLGRARAAAKLPNWLCPECSKNKPRDNGPDTPAKGFSETDSGEGSTSDVSNAAPRKLHNTSTDNNTKNLDTINLAVELRLFREQLSGVQDKIDLLRQDFQDLRNTLACHNSRIDTLEEKVVTLEREITTKQDAVGHYQAEINKLKCELSARDQELLSNDIEISNVPENDGENPSHLLALIGSKLGIALDERDIVYAERVGPKQARGGGAGGTNNGPGSRARSRPIIVRLTRRAVRDDLLRNMRVRRGANTADFGLAAESRPFYINERLTKYNRVLLHKAREARTRLHWRFVWTKRGRIFVKEDEGKPTYTIRSEDDLNRVFGNAAV